MQRYKLNIGNRAAKQRLSTTIGQCLAVLYLQRSLYVKKNGRYKLMEQRRYN